MKRVLQSLYPFFFAIYPILELRNYNVAYVDPASLYRPILLSVVFTGLIWLLLRLVMKDWQRAGIIATLAILLFFSYGHAYLQYEATFGDIPRHRYLSLAAVGILVLAAWFVRRSKNADGIVNFLTATGGILVAFSLFQSIQHDLSVRQAVKASEQNQAVETVAVDPSVQRPDIYLLLLDAHTRSDILLKDFNFDNSEFIQQLEDLGFYVAQCAQSNYPATKLSVTATFMADYHKDNTLYPVYSSPTIKTVKSLGYKVITFENRSNGHFDVGEDLRLSRNQMAFGRIDLTGGLSEFDMMLLRTSFLRIAIDMPQIIPGLDEQMLIQTEFYEHYQQTYYILDELKRLPEMDEPKFVFAHILVPHPPFIFTADGKFHWAEKAKEGYVSNTQFIESQLIPVLDEIISKSKVPPVIIVMGDHGPAGTPGITPEMRMSILNAYYVNDVSKQDLYPTITPVNSFRIVLNHYFGADYPLLKDISYHSYGMNQFTPDHIVPNTCEVSQ